MRNTTFHYLVVVDIEGFGARTVPMQASLRKAMYEVVSSAFEDCHLPWDDVVRMDRGDGIVMLIPPDTDPVTLAGPLVRALHENLREQASFSSAEHRMRMRAALHQGTCQQDSNGWTSEAINTAARLVDAAPLRAALAAAPAATMAFIASDDIYRSVIKQGYRHIDTASFAPVKIDQKEVHERAWIQVPGYPHPPKMEAGPEPPATASATRSATRSPAATRAHRDQPAAVHFYGPVTFGGGQINGDKIVYGDENHGDTTVHGAPL